jgi:hypothetical protein
MVKYKSEASYASTPLWAVIDCDKQQKTCTSKGDEPVGDLF